MGEKDKIEYLFHVVCVSQSVSLPTVTFNACVTFAPLTFLSQSVRVNSFEMEDRQVNWTLSSQLYFYLYIFLCIGLVVVDGKWNLTVDFSIET